MENQKKIKGNPVPSLDKKLIKKILFCLKHPKTIDAHIRLNLIKKLQNGRETDKEQPDEYEGLNGNNISYFRK